MHPRIAQLLAYVETQTETLRAAYESVPPDLRAVRPSPDRWSPAEVIHHLQLVERLLVRRLGQLIEQARALPPDTQTTLALSDASTKSALDRTRRFVTSAASEPHDTDATRVWDNLMATRRELLQVVTSGDGLDLGAVSASHPGLGALTGYEWIAFVGSHAGRHADQIREMQAQLVQ